MMNYLESLEILKNSIKENNEIRSELNETPCNINLEIHEYPELMKTLNEATRVYEIEKEIKVLEERLKELEHNNKAIEKDIENFNYKNTSEVRTPLKIRELYSKREEKEVLEQLKALRVQKEIAFKNAVYIDADVIKNIFIDEITYAFQTLSSITDFRRTIVEERDHVPYDILMNVEDNYPGKLNNIIDNLYAASKIFQTKTGEINVTKVETSDMDKKGEEEFNIGFGKDDFNFEYDADINTLKDERIDFGREKISFKKENPRYLDIINILKNAIQRNNEIRRELNESPYNMNLEIHEYPELDRLLKDVTRIYEIDKEINDLEERLELVEHNIKALGESIYNFSYKNTTEVRTPLKMQENSYKQEQKEILVKLKALKVEREVAEKSAIYLDINELRNVILDEMVYTNETLSNLSNYRKDIQRDLQHVMYKLLVDGEKTYPDDLYSIMNDLFEAQKTIEKLDGFVNVNKKEEKPVVENFNENKDVSSEIKVVEEDGAKKELNDNKEVLNTPNYQEENKIVGIKETSKSLIGRTIDKVKNFFNKGLKKGRK